MLQSTLIKKLEMLAPKENGMSKDIYGLQFGSLKKDREVSRIGICLDPSREVILSGLKTKIQFLISHHGVIHYPELMFNDDLSTQMMLFLKHNLPLFVMHTAWDAAPNGISETYAKVAGLEIIEPFFESDRGRPKPIGRICKPYQENTTVKIIANNLKRHLQLTAVQLSGNLQDPVEKIAVVGGKGFDTESLRTAFRLGVDTCLTGEMSYSHYLTARKLNLNIIATSHYKSEKIGMESLQKILAVECPRDEFIFIEGKDPIQYLT
jgi:dinuclear metal center YbgI/SA1388 family protein